jgi:hypothetical protein
MLKPSYEEKFKGFIQMCADAKRQGVEVIVVPHPEVLGDDYQEIVESLNRLAAARLALQIVPPDERGGTD